MTDPQQDPQQQSTGTPWSRPAGGQQPSGEAAQQSAPAPQQYGSEQPYGAQQPQYGAQQQYGAPQQYGGQQAYAQPYTAGYAPQPPRGLSITSMVLGIAGIVFIPVLGSIAALITGYMARKREPEGRPFWLTGIITGWVGVGLGVLYAIFIIGYIVILFGIFAAAGTSGGYS